MKSSSPGYTLPKPTQSLMGDVIISIISLVLLMWTGSFIERSHVEAVGRHLQLLGHPCTNAMLDRSWKPKRGAVLVPDIHFIISWTVIPSKREKRQHQQYCSFLKCSSKITKAGIINFCNIYNITLFRRMLKTH